MLLKFITNQGFSFGSIDKNDFDYGFIADLLVRFLDSIVFMLDVLSNYQWVAWEGWEKS